jgi:large subunit ribosomal protein L23
MPVNNDNYTNFLKLIKKPLISEKSILNNNKFNEYTLLVDISLTKLDLKIILENIFNIEIIKINTIILPEKLRKVNKKSGKITQYKKVIIRIKNNKKIDNFFN